MHACIHPVEARVCIAAALIHAKPWHSSIAPSIGGVWFDLICMALLVSTRDSPVDECAIAGPVVVQHAAAIRPHHRGPLHARPGRVSYVLCLIVSDEVAEEEAPGRPRQGLDPGLLLTRVEVIASPPNELFFFVRNTRYGADKDEQAIR